MSTLLFALAGLVLGVVVERLVGPPATSSSAVVAGAPARRRSRRRVVAWTAVGLVALLLVGAIGSLLWANAIFNRIEKVDVSAQLAEGSGTNYLLVGSDNGRTDADRREGVEGARSDTIMVLRLEGGRARMLSLNRDLWIDNPATGQQGRLNATYNAGPANLVQAVTANFGIPIHRYIEIDFVSFAGLVDSFGGIDITFEHPAFDLASGLDVKQAGVVHLDGAQALAYVRSRHYTEVIDGQPVPEGGLPDVNRTRRQQTFLRQVMAEAGASRNPLTLLSAANGMSDGLRVDDDMTLFDAARFAWRMGRLDPETVELPVVPFTTGGGAQVLELGEGADAVLQQFR